MAGSRGVKKRSHEKLTDSNIQHVIGLLNAKSPITKKEACSILNISYNTTRLGTIIIFSCWATFSLIVRPFFTLLPETGY